MDASGIDISNADISNADISNVDLFEISQVDDMEYQDSESCGEDSDEGDTDTERTDESTEEIEMIVNDKKNTNVLDFDEANLKNKYYGQNSNIGKKLSYRAVHDKLKEYYETDPERDSSALDIPK